uniref:SCP domain-containing protein n=1 Tax=Parastrongyloides trichosuri TaxID=131310 RepID=A0A0N4ZAF0_PARTI
MNTKNLFIISLVAVFATIFIVNIVEATQTLIYHYQDSNQFEYGGQNYSSKEAAESVLMSAHPGATEGNTTDVGGGIRSIAYTY